MAKRDTNDERGLFDSMEPEPPEGAAGAAAARQALSSGGGSTDHVALHEAAQSRYLNYALSVITSPTTVAHLRCLLSAVRFFCHIE